MSRRNPFSKTQRENIYFPLFDMYSQKKGLRQAEKGMGLEKHGHRASTQEESEETSQDSSASGTWVGPFRSAHSGLCSVFFVVSSQDSLIRHCPRWTDFINIFSLLLFHSSFSSTFFVIFHNFVFHLSSFLYFKILRPVILCSFFISSCSYF